MARPAAGGLGSTATREYDAIVVGSGPAGGSAAWRLASRGARVLVLEQSGLPRYKTCGGGIVGRGERWLPPDLELPTERRYRTVELHLEDSGRSFSVTRPTPIVSMVMRADFDRALLRSAERAGARVIDRCALDGLRLERDRVRVATSAGEFRSRAVIGADGVLGRVAGQAGWGSAPYCIPALECELEVDAATLRRFESAARFDFGTPTDGYAWLFPKREHLSVGVLCMRRGRRNLRQALRDYLGRLGIHRPRETKTHGFTIPIRPRSGGFVRGPVLLAGDAAGLADPVTAEGISYALQSGALAADSYITANGRPGATGRAFEAALRREVIPELRLGRMLARSLYGRPRMRSLLFRRFGQVACEAMTEVMLGRRSYRGLLFNPLNYLKLIGRREARRS